MDQTARKIQQNYKDKRILIIASGNDLDSRKLYDVSIYDKVCKVNKDYGHITNRCDIIFTRWAQWLDHFFDPLMVQHADEVIIVNQFVGITATEIEFAKKISGLEHVSAGFLAVLYFLLRGAKQVDLIGYGFLNGSFLKGGKKYCNKAFNYAPGYLDNNKNYDFNKEHEILQKLPGVNFVY